MDVKMGHLSAKIIRTAGWFGYKDPIAANKQASQIHIYFTLFQWNWLFLKIDEKWYPNVLTGWTYPGDLLVRRRRRLLREEGEEQVSVSPRNQTRTMELVAGCLALAWPVFLAHPSPDPARWSGFRISVLSLSLWRYCYAIILGPVRHGGAARGLHRQASTVAEGVAESEVRPTYLTVLITFDEVAE